MEVELIGLPIGLMVTVIALLAHIERLHVEIRDGRSAWCIERFRCQVLERELAAERRRVKEGPYR
jgi:hypothetical protein